MLKQRVLTAIILVPLLLAALFYLPLPWLTALFGLVTAAAAWEWAGLAGLQRFASRIAYVVMLLLFAVPALIAMPLQHDLAVPLLAAAGLWWLWALLEIFVRRETKQGLFATQIGRLAGGFLVLVPLWLAAVYLLAVDNERPRLLLFLLFLVWVADSAAYFAGSFFGRTKLAPHVSPGKTVEGVAGGVLGVVLLAWLCGTMLWKFEGALLAKWIGLAVVTALISVVGDLTESRLKRIAGVKDSGRLLPGHGGMLDRIDALTAAAPVFALGAILLMKY